MAKLTVYQKPTCSTCRDTLKILKEAGAEVEAINYYENPFTAPQLTALLKQGGLSPRDVLRTKEDLYKSLKLADASLSDEQLIAAMVRHPDLIQRPLVQHGDRVILARPPERVRALLKP